MTNDNMNMISDPNLHVFCCPLTDDQYGKLNEDSKPQVKEFDKVTRGKKYYVPISVAVSRIDDELKAMSEVQRFGLARKHHTGVIERNERQAVLVNLGLVVESKTAQATSNRVFAESKEKLDKQFASGAFSQDVYDMIIGNLKESCGIV